MAPPAPQAWGRGPGLPALRDMLQNSSATNSKPFLSFLAHLSHDCSLYAHRTMEAAVSFLSHSQAFLLPCLSLPSSPLGILNLSCQTLLHPSELSSTAPSPRKAFWQAETSLTERTLPLPGSELVCLEELLNSKPVLISLNQWFSTPGEILLQRTSGSV